MARYCTVAELAQFGLPSAATSGLDPADIEAQLDAACSEVDSCIAGRGWAVPLTTVGPDIKSCVARIAAWAVISGLRGINPDDAAHQGLRMNAMDARDWLGRVARGLANPSGVTPSRKAAGVITVIFSLFENGESTRGW